MNGLSLLDLLLVAAAIAASWRFFPHASPPPPGSVALDKPPSRQLPDTSDRRSLEPELKSAVPTTLEGTLKRICIANGYADIEAFLGGARRAYESISAGFASGDLEPSRAFLSREVHDEFARVIAERRQRGETVEQTFIGLKTADIVDAGLAGGRAWIEVRFAAEMVSVTRNRDGRNVAGHPAIVVEIAERWTFERELRSAQPHWILTATEAEQ